MFIHILVIYLILPATTPETEFCASKTKLSPRAPRFELNTDAVDPKPDFINSPVDVNPCTIYWQVLLIPEVSNSTVFSAPEVMILQLELIALLVTLKPKN